MIDKLSKKQRRLNMQAVRQKDTLPEMLVRSCAHRLGFRFRLHRKDLPGTPDLVFPRYKLCLFVHGCFWHSHPNCKRATVPKTNISFWQKKLSANRKRDQAVMSDLKKLGWKTAVIWECETKNANCLEKLLESILVLNHTQKDS